MSVTNKALTIDVAAPPATVFGSVSMTTIKATAIWKDHVDIEGRLPKEDFGKVLKKALVYLGWDDKQGGYTKEQSLNIRSTNSKNIVYKTTVFRFPVRANYDFKRIYEKLDILHVGEELFEGWNKSHTKLSEFGNEYQPVSEGFTNTEEVGEV